jgi:threonine dehydratase
MWDKETSSMTKITFSDIQQAHERIKPFIHNTPILTSNQVDQITGAQLFFKCENFQKVGAFKARGATNTVLSLSAEEKTKGVCTHSSGNHGQALAYAAKLNHMDAQIVMPSNAPSVKKDAVSGYGAHVIECTPTLAAREATVADVVKAMGCTLIHPYNDDRIITGQATAAKEVYEELGTDYLDYLLTPVGGGGLLSGSLLSTKYMSPSTQVIGCEPAGADDAYQSFLLKKHLPSVNPDTIADGLLTTVGEIPHAIIGEYVHDIKIVTDEEIIAAMKLTWERMKILIEPSSAVCLAVVLKHKTLFEGKKIGIILTGGNVDVKDVAKFL